MAGKVAMGQKAWPRSEPSRSRGFISEAISPAPCCLQEESLAKR